MSHLLLLLMTFHQPCRAVWGFGDINVPGKAERCSDVRTWPEFEIKMGHPIYIEHWTVLGWRRDGRKVEVPNLSR
jgi:hypothetical protein